MIRLENVSKTYQTGVPALNDISLNIEAGEFVFITGPSGSGKSTLIKLMLHEFDPTQGKIIVNGKNLQGVNGSPLSQKYRLRIPGLPSASGP